MLEIKDEEDSEPSISLDMAKLLDFCCTHKILIAFFNIEEKKMIHFMGQKSKGFLIEVMDFSDLYYPKNLLRTLKEKINNG